MALRIQVHGFVTTSRCRRDKINVHEYACEKAQQSKKAADGDLRDIARQQEDAKRLPKHELPERRRAIKAGAKQAHTSLKQAVAELARLAAGKEDISNLMSAQEDDYKLLLQTFNIVSALPLPAGVQSSPAQDLAASSAGARPMHASTSAVAATLETNWDARAGQDSDCDEEAT